MPQFGSWVWKRSLYSKKLGTVDIGDFPQTVLQTFAQRNSRGGGERDSLKSRLPTGDFEQRFGRVSGCYRFNFQNGLNRLGCWSSLRVVQR